MNTEYTGIRVIETTPELINRIYKEKTLLCEHLDGRLVRHLSQNEYVVLKYNGEITTQSAITRVVGKKLVLINNELKASGLTPRNKEQYMALDALMDDSIKVVILTGRAGTGKAQPLDAKVLTPTGFVEMGDIKVGSIILAPDGNKTKVLELYPQGEKDIYRVTFRDGSSTECCKDHLWYTKTENDRKINKPGSIKSLSKILTSLDDNHSIPEANKISFDKDSNSSVRYLDKIENIGRKEAQCILIDHPDHLYITDDFIVTHNTLLTLAAAMSKFEEKVYDRLILTRSMSWVGKHSLGYLPGDADEKLSPYLQNYMNNIEVLLGGKHKKVQDVIEQYRMDFIPIQLIRGASWNNAFIISDEVQIFGSDEMVALGTRVGEGSKLVIMGDLAQRDENIAREKTGIHKLINDNKVKESSFMASIDLIKCERSIVAKIFADVFER